MTPEQPERRMTAEDRLQIEMFVSAAASGRFSEWPLLRRAAKRMLDELAAVEAERDAVLAQIGKTQQVLATYKIICDIPNDYCKPEQLASQVAYLCSNNDSNVKTLSSLSDQRDAAIAERNALRAFILASPHRRGCPAACRLEVDDHNCTCGLHAVITKIKEAQNVPTS